MGIDGGGTKTEAWLACIETGFPNREPVIAGRGIAGPSNQRAVGADVAVQNLKRAIDAAFADHGMSRHTIDAMCFGLAGADRDSDRSVIEHFAQTEQLARSVTVLNDAMPLLYCGPHCTADEDGGIALICGTGSIAWGRNSRKETTRSGGWGYLFSDEGSSFAIGRDALRAVTQMVDGRGPETQLLRMISETMKLEQSQDLVARIYGAEFPKDVIAGLSEVVFLAAHAGDLVAKDILKRAAEDLAGLVSSVAHRLQLEVRTQLALAGAVLIRQPQFCDQVLQEIEDRGVRVRQHWLVEHPVLGAVRFAASRLECAG